MLHLSFRHLFPHYVPQHFAGPWIANRLEPVHLAGDEHKKRTVGGFRLTDRR